MAGEKKADTEGGEAVAQGRHAVLMDFGRGSPSSSAKTQVSPYSTVLERARRVAQADGGADSKGVTHGLWFERVAVILAMHYPSQN